MSGTSSPTPLRVAIVGAGLMGSWHARCAAAAGARVVAIADTDQPRADRIARGHRGCRAVPGLDDALALADVIHICTPTGTHAALVAQTLRARRHALVEKPLASTASETIELLALADAHGVILCPVHQFVFQDGVRAAAAHLNAIAPLIHLDFMICSAGATAGDDRTRDAVAFEVLPHPLSLVAGLLPGALPRMQWSARRPAAGELRVTGEADHVSISMLVSMRARPTRNRLEILGTGGSMHVDLFHGFVSSYPGSVSRARKITQPFVIAATDSAAAAVNLARRAIRREPAYPGLVRLMRQFYAGIGEGTPGPIPPADTLAVAEAWDAIAAITGFREPTTES